MPIWDRHQLHVQVKKTGWRFPPTERWMAEFLSFFYFHKDPFDALGPRQIYGKNVSSWRCSDRALNRPLRLALVYHCRRVSMWGQTKRREQNRSAALQTSASHTHMRWIKGQGSWVVLVGAQWCSVCHHWDFQ